MQEGASFCGACGARASRSEPAPVQSTFLPPEILPPDSTAAGYLSMVRHSHGRCPHQLPALRRHVNQRPAQTESGWSKLPGRKDMAKLQFGDSFCQIEGLYVPVADMNLAAPDSVYFAHHVLLWKDPQINVTTMPLSGGWKRLFAGMPLIMTQAQGPGHIAFSRDAPGEMIALPIQPGQAVDVREHLFMVATNRVAYDWFSTDVWFVTRNGNDKETHYPVGMFMDRFSAPQAPGLLLLHAAGNVFVRELAPGPDHSGKADGADFQRSVGADGAAF